MSHKANYWLASLDPARVKSGAFRVLFHLCDHHNGEVDPAVACFPSQETLRKKTGVSNGALNTALADMETEGLIMRRRSTIPGTSERRTYYILGCDFDLIATQTPENGVSPNSGAPETAKEQTPVLEGANSSFGPGKLRCTGEEPVITGKVTSSSSEQPAGEALSSDQLFDEILAAVGHTNGRIPTHWMPPTSIIHIERWRTDLGLTAQQILECARSSRLYHDTPPNGPKALDAVMQRYAATLNAAPLSIPQGRAQSAPPSQPKRNYSLAQWGIPD